MVLHKILAIGVTAAVFVAICGIMRSRGWKVVVLTCVFVASLVSTQLSMRLLPLLFKYKFPGLVTCTHFLAVSVVCTAYWTLKGELWRCSPSSLGLGRYLRVVGVISIGMPMCVVLNNKAMVYVGAGICAIIATMSPVCTAVLSRLFGRNISALSWIGVLVAFCGGVWISWTEISQVGANSENVTATDAGSHNSTDAADAGDAQSRAKKHEVVYGLILAFLSLIARAGKIVVMDHVLSPLAYAEKGARTEEPIEPLHLYALEFPLSTLISVLWSLATEDVFQATSTLTLPIFATIVFTMMNALVLNFVGLYVLKEFGASAQQIIGKLNTLCIASLSVAFLGETLPLAVLLGSCLVLAGVGIFEKGEHGTRGEDNSKDQASSSSLVSSEGE